LLAIGLISFGTVPGTLHAAGSAGSRPAALKGVHLANPGYLTVGSDTTYPPMESIDPQTHQALGADVDLANALAKAMGLKGAKIVTQTFDSIILALGRGNFDVIMSSMNDTPLRRKQIAFVDYMRSSEDILVRKSSSIHGASYSIVCGSSIAVESGTTELIGLNDANKHCKSKITIKSYALDTAAFTAFASGHTDAYTGDYPVCLGYVKSHPSAIRLTGPGFASGQDYGIGLPKKATALRSALVKALGTIKSNGQYAKILKKWGVGVASL
jgi:polar amino acid transport system substrate-binding protein